MGAERAELILLGLELPPLGSIKDIVLREALQQKKELLLLMVKYFSFILTLNSQLSDKQYDLFLHATSDLMKELFNIGVRQNFESELDPEKAKIYQKEEEELIQSSKEQKVPDELQKTFEFVQGLSDNYDEYDQDLRGLARAKHRMMRQKGRSSRRAQQSSFFDPQSSKKDVWSKIRDFKDA